MGGGHGGQKSLPGLGQSDRSRAVERAVCRVVSSERRNHNEKARVQPARYRTRLRYLPTRYVIGGAGAGARPVRALCVREKND